MFSKNNKTNKTYYKYLFSYTTIFLFPLIIMILLIYNYFFGILQNEVMLNNFNNLERAKTIIDTQIKQLKNISEQIYTNQNLNSFIFQEKPATGISVVKELKNLVTTNSFYEDIIIYYHGDNYIYSSNSSNTVSRFIGDIYNYENWDNDQFYNDINTLIEPTIRPAENVTIYGNMQKRFITFIFPLTYDGITPNKTVIFLVPEESLSLLFEDIVNNYNGNSVILDIKNQFITSLKNEHYLQTSDFNNLLTTNNDTNTKIISIENKEYLFSFIKSSETNWKYTTLVPVKEVMKKITTTKLVFIYVLILILGMGFAFIYYLMSTNYKPIQKLKQYSENILSNEKQPLNEFDMVQKTLDYLNTQNSEMYNQLQDNAHATKEHLLLNLLKGQISSIEELNKKGELIGLKLTNNLYNVIIIHINNFISKQNENIAKIIETSLPIGVEGYARDNTDQNCFALIVSYNKESEKNIENSLLSLQNNLKTSYDFITTIGIGEPYNQISQIPKSYMEAMNAIDYRLIKGIGKIIYYKEITSIPSIVDVSLYRAPERLKLLIKQGNIAQIENILVNILDYLKQNNTSIFTARIICYDIVNTIIQTMDELNLDYRMSKKDYPDVLLLSKFETVDEFAEIVRKISKDICEHLTESKENENVALLDQMINYIKDNYSDCDFSIQQMADYFKIALPNLSRYFKDHTGNNIIDYATNLKIDKAKLLLSSTDTPLKDVSVDVGYYNVTSFIRRFKQVVGITPGEYRKQQEKQS